MNPTKSAVEPQTVQSLTRGLAVIRTFGVDKQRQSLAQVAEATGLARATARRFLHTLVAEGYAGTDGSQFWLTPKILELGYSYMSGLGLPALAQPHLEELSRTVGESSSMSVLDRDEVVYVSRVPVRQIMTVSITIGTRLPAHNTSMGRVLLSGMSPEELDRYLASIEAEPYTTNTITNREELRQEIKKVGEQGYCIVDQELEVGLRSLAAPIYSSDFRVIAAINISTQVAKYSLEDIHSTFLPELLKTAEAISADVAAAQLA
ncbi:IclR family transcriptional regulator domain-containing protein [Corynebacterium vitaeruminis]|uniref:IclR family transcriptional regulator domain-containing protein n=1 Tax=Corynebacterium vitaeruminis TaxID=38305 RepID=UPI0028B133FB|nr:IclR family transcriptional regulator C-terminal domain-containing protein [Corynebacterium vitaeruminis]